jgi:bifunctional enzyme CysN/CysC
LAASLVSSLALASTMSTSRPERLEGAGLRLLWQAVAEANRPVMVRSNDDESAALLQLARRAFYPAPPPFPIVAREALAEEEAKRGFDLVIHGERPAGAGNQPAPIWRLGQTPTKRRGETVHLFPLAGWTAADVRGYVAHAGDAPDARVANVEHPALRVHTCGGSGSGKTTLAALLSGAPRGPGGPSFVVDDLPGQERDARGVLTAASNADLGVVVADVRQGLSAAVRRDIVLLSLLGVRQVVLAVNKIDLAERTQAAFARVEDEYRKFSAGLKSPPAACVPVSATGGDNILARAGATPWYEGPTLLDLLDAAESDQAHLVAQPLRLPVEWVFPSSSEFRGFAGTVVAGTIRVGDAVRVQPSGRISRVARIATPRGDPPEAAAGQSIAIALADEIELGRGDLLVLAGEPAEISDQFEATVVWMNPAPLLRGRGYLVRIGAQQVTGSIAPLKYKIDVSTLGRLAGVTLGQNEIGVCNVHLDREVAFDPYQVNHDTGGFLVIDRLSNETVGAGLLHFALRRAQNVHWQALEVNKGARADIKQQRACILWYTGLSGAGKSTIANLVDKKLHSLRRHTYLLDGDNVRHGLNKDLGFTDVDRVENIRRIGEVAKLMVDAGLIVSTAFISPFRAERMMARALVEAGEFVEIFIDTPLGVAEERDPKGLYKKARRGDLKNFTGIDSPYEAPENPELRIDTTAASPEEAAVAIVSFLRARGVLT